MKIAVIGKSGQVARSLVDCARATDREVACFGRPQLDLATSDNLERLVDEFGPDVVVNAAGYTWVDQAEDDVGVANLINAAGARHIAQVCSTRALPIVHLSTDYVYDGSKPEPYVETDPALPLGVYGHSKLTGDRLVAATCAQHIILRTAWIISPYGRNFASTMLRLAKDRTEISVVDDQRGCPTYAPHLAEVILDIARQVTGRSAGAPGWGIYHVCGRGEATWRELAEEVFRTSRLIGGPSARVVPITTAEYPTTARRPANSRLNCDALHQAFGHRLPPWQAGTKECVERLLNED